MHIPSPAPHHLWSVHACCIAVKIMPGQEAGVGDVIAVSCLLTVACSLEFVSDISSTVLSIGSTTAVCKYVIT